MTQYNKTPFPSTMSNGMSDACAILYGSNAYPEIYGIANFFQLPGNSGLMIEIQVMNLPNTPTYAPRFFGMHIHENGDCSDNFMETGMHYNPTNAVHPYHLGDLPPLFNSNGFAYLVFYDSFLNLNDIIDRSLIIHETRDDFTTQPSGDSGDKIACGIIQQK